MPPEETIGLVLVHSVKKFAFIALCNQTTFVQYPLNMVV
jgi:hypothetical protein